MGLRALELESGVSKKTLEGWSKQGLWVERRRQFQARVRTETEEKNIDLLSDELSTELSKASIEHFSAYSDSYWLAKEYFAAHRRIALQLQATERDHYVTSINAIAIDKASLVLDRAIRGMRMVAGLQYEDYSQAIAFLKRGGYEVVESSQSDQVTTEVQGEGSPES